MCVANTSSCSYRTEVTFYWKAKYYYLLSPRIVRFIAFISSFTFFFCSRTNYYSIYSAIQSFYLAGTGLTGIVGFFIELTRFCLSFTEIDSFSLFCYRGISFGGSLGWGGSSRLLFWAELITFGGILFCEFLGYKICFTFWGCFWLSSFLMLLTLSVLWTYFFISTLLLISGFD